MYGNIMVYQTMLPGMFNFLGGELDKVTHLNIATEMVLMQSSFAKFLLQAQPLLVSGISRQRSSFPAAGENASDSDSAVPGAACAGATLLHFANVPLSKATAMSGRSHRGRLPRSRNMSHRHSKDGRLLTRAILDAQC